MPQGYIWYSPLAKAMLGGIVAISASTADAQTVRAASVTVPAPRPAEVRVVNDGGALSLETATRMVEDYFNNMTTLQAEFSQSVTGEAFGSEGTFYLKRPRQFLWQYDTPVRQKIVSTGTAVYYIDQSSKRGDGQVTQLPLDAGLARLFGAKILKLNGSGLKVTGVRSTASDLTLTLTVGKGGDEAGLKTVRMTFGRAPFVIRSLEAVDVTNVTTKVAFFDVKAGVPLTAKMFEYTPGVYRQAN